MDARRLHRMEIAREREGEEPLGREAAGELVAVVPEVAVDRLDVARVEATPELHVGPVRRHRQLTGDGQRFAWAAGLEPELDDTPLDDPTRGRHGMRPVRGADHD